MKQRNILGLWSLMVILLGVCSAAYADQTVQCTSSWLYELQGVHGAALNQLRVNLNLLPSSEVGHTLANDQIHMMRMAEGLGLNIESKHVPALLGGNYVYSGGIYLFIGDQADAQSYLDNVVSSGYALYDPEAGEYIQFAQRPEFEGTADLHAMKVLGAARFLPLDQHYAIKVTEWHLAQVGPVQELLLRLLWHANLRRTACERGLAEALLLYNAQAHRLVEVLYSDKVEDPPSYFEATLNNLYAQPPLLPLFDSWFSKQGLPYLRLVLTIWPGTYEPSYWPNSLSATPGGFLPEPECGDGSCNTTATHSEDAVSCPSDCALGNGNFVCTSNEAPTPRFGVNACAHDCLPTCNDGANTCDAGENANNCPADCH